MQHKAYKFRLYPNKEQLDYFAKCFGCARFIYNKMLADRIEYYENHGQYLNNTPAQYKDKYPWLKEVDSLALANAQINLNNAYKKFFKEPVTGFPNFKSKKTNHFKYTTNNQNGNIYIKDGYIKLPKLKTPVRVKQHRMVEGEIKSCTISKTPSGKYFVSVLTETEINNLPENVSKVGIDVGLKEFAVLSDGTIYENPKHLRKSEKRLAKLQKDLSRKKKASKNYQKARQKVAKLHEKIHNQRQDFLHKVSSKIVSENQAIVIEDLRVKNLLRNHKLAKAISEASWSMFRKMLEYKADWYGRELIVAPSNYASSQLCSSCGEISKQTKDLSCRMYKCAICGSEIDRDYNASLNLLKLAG